MCIIKAKNIIRILPQKFGCLTFSAYTRDLKQKLSISFLSVAVFMLMVIAVVPHHHHSEMACLVMERCEQDRALNDEHTGHHSDNKMAHNSCISEIGYIAQQSDNETKCKVSSCNNHNHIHLFPAFYLLADFLIYNNVAYSAPKPNLGEYLSFYKSAEISQFHGLRAPPCFLV